MAQEPSPVHAKAPWMKIFTAFKVALDLKKIALAAAGILLAFLGWWLLSVTFYSMRSEPLWKNFEDKDQKEPEQVRAQWNHFKAKRASWDLMHELAGPTSPTSPSERKKIDAGDVASNPEEFLLLQGWEEGGSRKLIELTEPIMLNVIDKTLEVPALGNKFFKWSAVIPDEAKKLPVKTTLGELTIDDAAKKQIRINGVAMTVDEGNFDELKKLRDGALNSTQSAKWHAALLTFNTYLLHPKYKPAGRLRVSPWSEYRGGNPYLIVADTLKTPGNAVGTSGSLLHWVLSPQVLVLVEPLVKFLLPVVFLFDARAGFVDRLYLILILLWTLAVWGFFGGAICRIAAVQIARNERISLREAIGFTRERFLSFVAAPVFPMALLAIFVFALMIFGWIEWIPYLGDLFAGLLWPIVLIVGFIMAIVMVGLVGWPMMIATISTEGTDSFDALSRSYSYIYQAPWQYLWYNFLALLYGAVLIFFIGFMASLAVFVGKWSVSSAPGLSSSLEKTDREPSYLFYYAPTSYGWRDLLISSNQFVEKHKDVTPGGKEIERLEFTPEYEKNISTMNRIGAVLVSLWIYPFFLLVLGFGYSYFWSVSTIIYFLMRRYVDDTEMDEVHLDDEDLEDPFMKPAAAPASAAPPAPPSKPGTLSLNVVEAPPPPPAPVAPPVATTFAPELTERPIAPSEPMIPPPLAPPAPPLDGHS